MSHLEPPGQMPFQIVRSGWCIGPPFVGPRSRNVFGTCGNSVFQKKRSEGRLKLYPSASDLSWSPCTENQRQHILDVVRQEYLQALSLGKYVPIEAILEILIRNSKAAIAELEQKVRDLQRFIKNHGLVYQDKEAVTPRGKILLPKLPAKSEMQKKSAQAIKKEQKFPEVCHPRCGILISALKLKDLHAELNKFKKEIYKSSKFDDETDFDMITEIQCCMQDQGNGVKQLVGHIEKLTKDLIQLRKQKLPESTTPNNNVSFKSHVLQNVKKYEDQVKGHTGERGLQIDLGANEENSRLLKTIEDLRRQLNHAEKQLEKERKLRQECEAASTREQFSERAKYKQEIKAQNAEIERLKKELEDQKFSLPPLPLPPPFVESPFKSAVKKPPVPLPPVECFSQKPKPEKSPCSSPRCSMSSQTSGKNILESENKRLGKELEAMKVENELLKSKTVKTSSNHDNENRKLKEEINKLQRESEVRDKEIDTLRKENKDLHNEIKYLLGESRTKENATKQEEKENKHNMVKQEEKETKQNMVKQEEKETKQNMIKHEEKEIKQKMAKQVEKETKPFKAIQEEKPNQKSFEHDIRQPPEKDIKPIDQAKLAGPRTVTFPSCKMQAQKAEDSFINDVKPPSPLVMINFSTPYEQFHEFASPPADTGNNKQHLPPKVLPQVSESIQEKVLNRWFYYGDDEQISQQMQEEEKQTKAICSSYEQVQQFSSSGDQSDPGHGEGRRSLIMDMQKNYMKALLFEKFRNKHDSCGMKKPLQKNRNTRKVKINAKCIQCTPPVITTSQSDNTTASCKRNQKIPCFRTELTYVRNDCNRPSPNWLIKRKIFQESSSRLLI